MASSDSVVAVLYVLKFVSLATLFYAAYWAFDIRHALAVRIYKNQILGVGLLSILFVYTFFISSIGAISGPYGSLIGILELLFGLAGILGVLYFVDASVLASRRLDPLLRDILCWSKVRYAFWAYEIFATFFTLLDAIFSHAAGTPLFLTHIVTYGYTISFPFVFLVPLFSFLVLIPVAIRAKDPQLREHFRWLGLMAVIALVYLIPLGGPSTTPEGLLIGTIVVLILGYCLYKSARSLVPLNRISQLDGRPKAGSL